jgi:hypothetical protein
MIIKLQNIQLNDNFFYSRRRLYSLTKFYWYFITSLYSVLQLKKHLTESKLDLIKMKINVNKL